MINRFGIQNELSADSPGSGSLSFKKPSLEKDIHALLKNSYIKNWLDI
ncbi:MAG: hypothetical protein GY729_12495 [Desulfobacteraceae bacterium]|nr:hypothetical protein [Desulfobacteraceae bacterium]